MKILFLDDEAMRHDWADSHYAGHEVHHAYNFEQFKRALLLGRMPRGPALGVIPVRALLIPPEVDDDRSRGPFDLVSFDYDIEGFLCTTQITGLTCADWMVARPDLHPRACAVHSWNPGGGSRLVLALECAGFKVTRRMAGGEG